MKVRFLRGLERALIFGILLFEVSRVWMGTKRQYYVQQLRDRLTKNPKKDADHTSQENRSRGSNRSSRFSSSDEFQQSRSKKKPRAQD
jgi:hypothetical protein